jgi:hypothetical protein
MHNTFQNIPYFNSDISKWSTSEVTSMNHAFQSAVSFAGDLNSWDTSKVSSLRSTFREAIMFNSDLNSWQVSRVTDLNMVFFVTFQFNGPVAGWDTTSVTNFASAFEHAASFNQPLSAWDVSAATSMIQMLRKAQSFNQGFTSDSSWTCPTKGQDRLKNVKSITIEGAMDSVGLHIAEVQAFDFDGKLIPAFKATMSKALTNPRGSGSSCIDGNHTTRCSVYTKDWQGNDVNDGKTVRPWLTIEFRYALDIQKIVVTPSLLAEHRIDSASISIGMNSNDVAWSSTFTSEAASRGKFRKTPISSSTLH